MFRFIFLSLSALVVVGTDNWFQPSCSELIDGLTTHQTIIGVGLAKQFADFPYRSELEKFLTESSKLASSAVVLYSFGDTADEKEEIVKVHFDSSKDNSGSAIQQGLDDLVARSKEAKFEKVPVFEAISCGSTPWPSAQASVHLILSGGIPQDSKSNYIIHSKQCGVVKGGQNLAPENWKRQTVLMFDPSVGNISELDIPGRVDGIFDQNLTSQPDYDRFAGYNLTIAALTDQNRFLERLNFELRAAFCDNPSKASDSIFRIKRLVSDAPGSCMGRFFGSVDSVTISWVINQDNDYLWDISFRQVLTELIKLMPHKALNFYNVKYSTNLNCLYKDVDIEECNELDSLGSGLSAITNASDQYSKFSHIKVHVTGDMSSYATEQGLWQSIRYLQSQRGRHVNLFFTSYTERGLYANDKFDTVQRYVSQLQDDNVAIISVLPDVEGNDQGAFIRTDIRSVFSDKQVIVRNDDVVLRDPAIIAADLAAEAMRTYCYYPRTKSIPQLLEGCEISRLHSTTKKVSLRIAVSLSGWTSWVWNSQNLNTVFTDVESKLKEMVNDVNVTFVAFEETPVCIKDSAKPIYYPIRKEDLAAKLRNIGGNESVVDTTRVVGDDTVGLDVLYGLGLIEQPTAEDEIAINIIVTQGFIHPGDKVTDISQVGREGACGTVYQHPEAKSHYAATVDRAKTFNFVLVGIDERDYRNATDWQTKINSNLGDFRATVIDLDIGPLPASDVSEGLTHEILNQMCIQKDKKDSVPVPLPTFKTCEYDPNAADVTIWFQSDANVGRAAQADLKGVIDEIHKNLKAPVSYGIFQTTIEGECNTENDHKIVVMKNSDPNVILDELNRIPFLPLTADIMTRSYGLNLLAVKEDSARPSVNIIFAVGDPITNETSVPYNDLTTSDLSRMGLCYGVQQHPRAKQYIATHLGDNTRNYVFLAPHFNGYTNKDIWRKAIKDVFSDTTEFLEGKTDISDMTPKDLADLIQQATVDALCRWTITTTPTTTTTGSSARPIIIGCTVGAAVLGAVVGGGWVLMKSTPSNAVIEMQDEQEINFSDIRNRPAAESVGVDQVAFP